MAPLVLGTWRPKTTRVAILANGPSLSDWPLERLSCDVIGVNRSWAARTASVHVAVESQQLRWMADAGAGADVLFAGEDTEVPPDIADAVVRVKALSRAVGGTPLVGWSDDLTHGAYVRGASYLALQVAVWIGYRKIFFFGLDLKPRGAIGHFWEGSHPLAPHAAHSQAEAFGYAAAVLEQRGVEVFLVGHDSILTCFPRVPFEAALGIGVSTPYAGSPTVGTDWIDDAAEEIAGDPQCCDISSSGSSRMAEIIRKHLRCRV